jgi:hypothetical protein
VCVRQHHHRRHITRHAPRATRHTHSSVARRSPFHAAHGIRTGTERRLLPVPMLLSPLHPVRVAGGGGAPTRALGVRGTETRHTPPHRRLPTTATQHSPCFWNRNKSTPNVCSNAAAAVSGVRHGTIAGACGRERSILVQPTATIIAPPTAPHHQPQQLEHELARCTMAILLMLEHRSRRSGTCSCAASACKCACSRALGAGAHRPWKHQPSRPLQCQGRPARAACVSARRARPIMEYHIIGPGRPTRSACVCVRSSG